MNIYNFKANNINGEEIDFSIYKGKVILVVNTASKCGFTPQFKELEELYKKYNEQGLEILGFPCNQFASQDPASNSEIGEFCKLNYGVTFTMFEKIMVNGENEHPLYKFLKEQTKQTEEEDSTHHLFEKVKDMFKNVLGTNIKWNFTKFLVDTNGNVIKRYSPTVAPNAIGTDIEKLM